MSHHHYVVVVPEKGVFQRNNLVKNFNRYRCVLTRVCHALDFISCREFCFKSNVVFNVKKIVKCFLVAWLLNTHESALYSYRHIALDNTKVFFVKKNIKKQHVPTVHL